MFRLGSISKGRDGRSSSKLNASLQKQLDASPVSQRGAGARGPSLHQSETNHYSIYFHSKFPDCSLMGIFTKLCIIIKLSLMMFRTVAFVFGEFPYYLSEQIKSLPGFCLKQMERGMAGTCGKAGWAACERGLRNGPVGLRGVRVSAVVWLWPLDPWH